MKTVNGLERLEQTTLRPAESSANAPVFANRRGHLAQIPYPQNCRPGSGMRSDGAHGGEGLPILPQGCPDGSDGGRVDFGTTGLGLSYGRKRLVTNLAANGM